MWVDVLPLSRAELDRLITYKDRVRAYSLAMALDEIDPQRLAKRLTFARFLVVTGVLSEWEGVQS